MPNVVRSTRLGIVASLLLLWVSSPLSGATPPKPVTVYSEPGRFGGWPANHGIWIWGNEILVGFSAGYHKDMGDRHHIDREQPEEHLLARSLDGGQSWTIENPAKKGSLIPTGKALHGVTPPGLAEPEWRDCPGNIDFTHPDFALTVRMTDVHSGPSRFYYSTNRGRLWEGPFRLPNFGQAGIAARTDYVVTGKHDCTLFLTAPKSNGKEGRPLCVRTTDGGKSWSFVGWIGSEPEGYAIMPSTLRSGDAGFLTAIRCRNGDSSWIDTYRSSDDGRNWVRDGAPVANTGEGNPPSLIRLKDGRVCLTYGHRAAPFGIRAKLSADDGRSWGPEIVLRDEAGGRDIGYPRTVQREDGKVVSVYYFHDTPKGERYIAATIWDPNSFDNQPSAKSTNTTPTQDILIRPILGPQDPGGPYKHPASITELASGDLYVAFYGGNGEYNPDTAVWGSRLTAGSNRWSAPVVIADTPFHSDGNATVWQAPGGPVWLFYVVRYGETWSKSRIHAKVSRDGAHTWSDAMVLAGDLGMMVRGRPHALPDGDWLLPIYQETGEDTEVVGADSTSLFLRYAAKSNTWSESGRIRSRKGNIQPAIAQAGENLLVAYCRRAGGYGPNETGYIIRSESRDNGRTWSEGLDSRFPNPNAAVDFLRLHNGHLLLVYNDSMNERNPLSAALSTDGDKTYPHRRVIISGGPKDFAYPYLIQTRDHKIHLIFTSDKRSIVQHAVFDEQALLPK